MSNELYQVQKHGDQFVVVDTRTNVVLTLATTKKPYTFATEAEAQAFADLNNAAYRRHEAK